METKLNTSREEIEQEKQRTIHLASPTGLMKAIQVHHYGGANQLVYETAPIPKPGADEVLIRVYGASVNPVDWKVREGMMKDQIQHQFPYIPGRDVAGVVVSTGILVTCFEQGDFVFAMADLSGNGSYAEYCVVKAKDIAYAPGNIPIHEAAAVPLAAQTAWTGLFEVGSLRENQKILIHGASGGVGSFAVQLARLAGALVIATTSAKNADMVRSLGAHHVIDYETEDFGKDLFDIDMVFDTIGRDTQVRSWKVLRKHGTLVSTVGVDQEAALQHGVTGKSYMTTSCGARLQAIAALIDKRLLRVTIAGEFPLAQAAEAQEFSKSGKVSGKLVLRVNSGE